MFKKYIYDSIKSIYTMIIDNILSSLILTTQSSFMMKKSWTHLWNRNFIKTWTSMKHFYFCNDIFT